MGSFADFVDAVVDAEDDVEGADCFCAGTESLKSGCDCCPRAGSGDGLVLRGGDIVCLCVCVCTDGFQGLMRASAYRSFGRCTERGLIFTLTVFAVFLDD